MALAAEVAVQGATVYFDKLYTYEVPTPMEGHIFVGSMVLVPFGRGSMRPRTGVVLALREVAEFSARTKSLYDVAPGDARLTEELLAVVHYLKEATFCTWFEAVRAVIPYGAQYKPVLRGQEWALQKQIVRHTEVVYSLPDEAPMQKESHDEAAVPALATERALSAKQKQVLEYLANGPCTRAKLIDDCGVTRAVPDGLVKRGLVAQTEQDKQAEMPLSLPSFLNSKAAGSKPMSLSPMQQEVTDGLAALLNQQADTRPALLYGVTGSGKTMVFLELVRQVLVQGKSALLLVPEIGLTPQMMGHVLGAFGSLVAVQHSGLSATERLLQWRQIQRGEARVVVGTRSAVFAPLENIGLIVIDEQQERSYQSENAPRYDALEVAKRRAVRHGALLLMASATPSVTDYYAAKKRRYHLFCLTQRYGDLPLPAVQMADMREELLGGNAGIISAKLAVEIAQNLADSSQTILLLNRRGYHRVGVCRSCREVLKCTDCSVPMVYHKAGAAKETSGAAQVGRLLCHYCGQGQSPAPTVCPACGGEIVYTGFGTQRMEEELHEKFPSARVLRMDLDSTSRKGSHASMLKRFGTGEYDIMLGTQMVAKGLDFERVSLVGVVGVDSLLFSQGYRAYETVFSLVTQVVGRSGRSGAPGRALIQTMDPNNPVLTLAAKQDYDAFYRQEIAFRKLSLYPPFCALCVVGFVGKEQADALNAAKRFSVLVAGNAKQQPGLPLRVLGPAPMSVAQIAGSYRYRLTLKCRNDAAFRALVWRVMEEYNKEGWPRKATAFLDFHSEGG